MGTLPSQQKLFRRDDCGGFVYPNGFRFPLEDTGNIIDAAAFFHGGQGCPLYQLAGSWHATPELVCAAKLVLDETIPLLVLQAEQWAETQAEGGGIDIGPALQLGHEIEVGISALEALDCWAAGVQDLLE